MCVLAIWLGLDPNTTLVIGANRDEAYARPSAPPSEFEPGIVAGRDLESGGTWLGLARGRLFVAITNRKSPPRTTETYSRGLLVMDALRCDTLDRIESVVTARVLEHPPAGFNLVAIDGNRGICFHFDGALRRATFGAGAHVVSSDMDLNDPRMPEKRAFDQFVATHPGIASHESLREFLGSHEGERPICKHGGVFGTVSSTIVTLDKDGARMWYANGPPCRTSFTAISSSLSPRP